MWRFIELMNTNFHTPTPYTDHNRPTQGTILRQMPIHDPKSPSPQVLTHQLHE
ncbi:hypothetical protein DSL72_004986 [Monilinia vaccinii-corymbosi]|uniref:Uncharacterized protein n=1 Tax=Monilinia vaccinii-corymbosi TaxID=61207 RepID=A0A8A3PE62_9HELO|nr:hypothetical protein DSL72_004986 [Monilinia vaccinii-corymbosi]